MREYHFARALGQRGALTYLYFADPGTEPLTRKDLPFCHEVIAIPKPSAYGPAKLAQGVLGRWPLPVLNYTSAEMSAAVDRVAGASSYDLIHLDGVHMIRYGDIAARHGGSATRIVYNWHNIESEAMLRFSATVSSASKRWYARLTARKLASLEQRILKTAFGHVVCSVREREELQGLAPSARIAVVENGVDVASFQPRANISAPSRKLVFAGLMDYSERRGSDFFRPEHLAAPSPAISRTDALDRGSQPHPGSGRTRQPRRRHCDRDSARGAPLTIATRLPPLCRCAPAEVRGSRSWKPWPPVFQWSRRPWEPKA